MRVLDVVAGRNAEGACNLDIDSTQRLKLGSSHEQCTQVSVACIRLRPRRILAMTYARDIPLSGNKRYLFHTL